MSMTAPELTALYQRHVNTVYRVCYTFFGNAADTEDAVQETFIKAMRQSPAFESTEHEKAWLIRVASNHCKDVLKSTARKNLPLEDAGETPAQNDTHDDTLDAVMRLEPKYKDVIYLHYYEGYSAEEIARIVERPASTVRNHLSEARAILRTTLGE